MLALPAGPVAMSTSLRRPLWRPFSNPTLTLRGNASGLAHLTLGALNGNITAIVAGRNLSNSVHACQCR
jgi:hypothetical protein